MVTTWEKKYQKRINRHTNKAIPFSKRSFFVYFFHFYRPKISLLIFLIVILLLCIALLPRAHAHMFAFAFVYFESTFIHTLLLCFSVHLILSFYDFRPVSLFLFFFSLTQQLKIRGNRFHSIANTCNLI